MNAQLEKQLAEKFPFMKRGNPYEDLEHPNYITNLYAAFGYEMEDGWHSVIEGLCEDIVKAYEKAGVPIDFQPLQIKEKYGSLHFYYTCNSSESSLALREEVAKIVEHWEKKSESVCERCGAEGKLRPDLLWILTLCDNCYHKKLEAMAKEEDDE